MVFNDTTLDECPSHRRNVYTSLYVATQVIEDVANGLYTDLRCQRRQNTSRGYKFNNAAPDRYNILCTESTITRVSMIERMKFWIQDHEDAQVMLASMLVVLGVWWLIRTVISLVFNLMCPLLVVVFAVVCVPQLRTPLLGQNYPAVANLLRSILLKLAETLKT